MFNIFRARKGLTKSIFWALILVMAAGMVMFFVPSSDRVGRLQGGNGDVVATVGDVPITGKELQQALERYRRQFAQYNPGGDLSFLKQLKIEQRALDDLIQQHLVEAEAARLGIMATPEEVVDKIQKFPAFMVNGQFIGRNEYVRILQANRIAPAEFEDSLRTGILQEKLQGFVSDGVIVTPEEIRQEWLTRNEKATIEYVLFDPKSLEGDVNPSEAELQDYFNKHQEQYKGAEERKVKYIFVDQDALRNSVTVSEQELRDEFKKNPGETEVRVSHILFKTENKSEQEIEPIRKKAEDVLKQTLNGGDFAALARQYSEDEGSAPNGGEMPFATRQTYVPEFSETAFKLSQPGEIAPTLTKTQYGFHIIKLLERRDPTFEARRAQLDMTLKNTKVQDEARQLADKVDSSLRQTKDLNKTAKELNLTVAESSFFKSNASVVTPIKGSARAMVTKVFQLKNPGEFISPAAKISSGYIVAQLAEVKPPAIPPFAEAQTRVQADYKKAKAEELANAKAGDFAKALEADKNIESAAKRNKLEVHTSNEFKRNDQIDTVLTYAPEVMEKVFALKAGEPSGVVSVASGNKKVVFVVKSRPELDGQQLEKDKGSIQDELANRKRSTFFSAYLNGLKEKMEKDKKIRVNQEVFKRYSL